MRCGVDRRGLGRRRSLQLLLSLRIFYPPCDLHVISSGAHQRHDLALLRPKRRREISFKPAELPGWKRFPQGMTFGLFRTRGMTFPEDDLPMVGPGPPSGPQNDTASCDSKYLTRWVVFVSLQASSHVLSFRQSGGPLYTTKRECVFLHLQVPLQACHSERKRGISSEKAETNRTRTALSRCFCQT